jgi:hypothetical protein
MHVTLTKIAQSPELSFGITCLIVRNHWKQLRKSPETADKAVILEPGLFG